MCKPETETISTAPPNADYYVDIACDARDRLEKGQALVVTPPKGKQMNSFLSGVQRALNDSRYEERFDAYPDAGGKKLIVKRTR